MAQLMPLSLTVSCSSKIQIGFTFLVPAYPGCPGKEAVKWLCVQHRNLHSVGDLLPFMFCRNSLPCVLNTTTFLSVYLFAYLSD